MRRRQHPGRAQVSDPPWPDDPQSPEGLKLGTPATLNLCDPALHLGTQQAVLVLSAVDTFVVLGPATLVVALESRHRLLEIARAQLGLMETALSLLLGRRALDPGPDPVGGHPDLLVRGWLGSQVLRRREGEEDVGGRSLQPPIGLLDHGYQLSVGGLGPAGIRLRHHLVGEEVEAVGGVRGGIVEGSGGSHDTGLLKLAYQPF